MDKWMLAGMICLMAMNFNVVLQKPVAIERDDFATLAKLYEEETVHAQMKEIYLSV